jgi:hypothetical protein
MKKLETKQAEVQKGVATEVTVASTNAAKPREKVSI